MAAVRPAGGAAWARGAAAGGRGGSQTRCSLTIGRIGTADPANSLNGSSEVEPVERTPEHAAVAADQVDVPDRPEVVDPPADDRLDGLLDTLDSDVLDDRHVGAELARLVTRVRVLLAERTKRLDEPLVEDGELA